MKRTARATWTVGARSETGYVRDENEDRMSRVRFREGYAYIVSDGMGGHKGGAKAAEMTVQTLEQHLAAMQDVVSVDDALGKAFAAANSCVYEAGHPGSPQTAGMGATAVVCVTTQSAARIAHVGDSRAYLHRRQRLTRLTRDHTRAQCMVDAGVLSLSEADGHPDADVLVRAIGESPTVEVDIGPWLHLKKGDEILLCSDGLCGEADDLEIEEALRHNEIPRRLVDRLIALALDKGGNDNVTVQLIRYGNRAPPFEWRPFRSQIATLAILAMICLTAFYFVNRRLEAALTENAARREGETRALRASIEDWKEESSQELRAIKQQLALVSSRLEQQSAIPQTSAVRPHSASVKGRSRHRTSNSSASRSAPAANPAPMVRQPTPAAITPTPPEEGKQ
jgi:protein phosphatase